MGVDLVNVLVFCIVKWPASVLRYEKRLYRDFNMMFMPVLGINIIACGIFYLIEEKVNQRIRKSNTRVSSGSLEYSSSVGLGSDSVTSISVT